MGRTGGGRCDSSGCLLCRIVRSNFCLSIDKVESICVLSLCFAMSSMSFELSLCVSLHCSLSRSLQGQALAQKPKASERNPTPPPIEPPRSESTHLDLDVCREQLRRFRSASEVLPAGEGRWFGRVAQWGLEVSGVALHQRERKGRDIILLRSLYAVTI